MKTWPTFRYWNRFKHLKCLTPILPTTNHRPFGFFVCVNFNYICNTQFYVWTESRLESHFNWILLRTTTECRNFKMNKAQTVFHCIAFNINIFFINPKNDNNSEKGLNWCLLVKQHNKNTPQITAENFFFLQKSAVSIKVLSEMNSIEIQSNYCEMKWIEYTANIFVYFVFSFKICLNEPWWILHGFWALKREFISVHICKM